MSDAPLTFEADLDAPPEKVWRALAEPELRAAWLGEREGKACEVIEAAPGERLTIRFNLDEPPSLVTFEIAGREGETTHLTITHSPATAQVTALFPRRRAAAPTRMAA